MPVRDHMIKTKEVLNVDANYNTYQTLELRFNIKLIPYNNFSKDHFLPSENKD